MPPEEHEEHEEPWMYLTLETIGKLNYKDLNNKQSDDFKPSDVLDINDVEEYYLPQIRDSNL